MSNNNQTNHSTWSDYLAYLCEWVEDHREEAYAGMSPACYDEWLDNEDE